MVIWRDQQTAQCGWSKLPRGLLGPGSLRSPHHIVFCLETTWAARFLGGVYFVPWGESPSVSKALSLFEMLFALGSAVVIVILVNCYSSSFIMGSGTGRKGAALLGLNFPAGF